MSIHTQPDLCLSTIFSDLPLIDLVRIGQVCPRWNQLQPSITSRVRALTIKVGQNNFDLIEGSNFVIDQLKYLKNEDGTSMAEPLPCQASSFHFRELKSEKVRGLARTFANVSKLVISLNCVDSAQLCLVAELLHLLRATLVTLKIYYCRIRDKSKLNCIPQCHSVPFFNAINLLSSLKHLLLDFESHFAFHRHNELMDPLLETTQIDLPILTQLDQFDFHSPEYVVDVLYESLRRYAQHSARPLRLSHGYGRIEIPKLLQLDVALCRRITKLNLSCEPLNDTHLSSVCTRLSSLTSLYTEAEKVTIPELFTKLAQLTQLIHLQLDVVLDWPQQSPDPTENISRLDSIRSLDLSFTMTNHNNLTMLQLPWTLPNLQVISVYLYDSDRLKCDICEYDEDDGGDNHVNLDQMKRCLKQLLAPLAQCPRLQTISEFKSYKIRAENITKQQLDQGTFEFVEL